MRKIHLLMLLVGAVVSFYTSPHAYPFLQTEVKEVYSIFPTDTALEVYQETNQDVMRIVKIISPVQVRIQYYVEKYGYRDVSGPDIVTFTPGYYRFENSLSMFTVRPCDGNGNYGNNSIMALHTWSLVYGDIAYVKFFSFDTMLGKGRTSANLLNGDLCNPGSVSYRMGDSIKGIVQRRSVNYSTQGKDINVIPKPGLYYKEDWYATGNWNPSECLDYIRAPYNSGSDFDQIVRCNSGTGWTTCRQRFLYSLLDTFTFWLNKGNECWYDCVTSGTILATKGGGTDKYIGKGEIDSFWYWVPIDTMPCVAITKNPPRWMVAIDSFWFEDAAGHKVNVTAGTDNTPNLYSLHFVGGAGDSMYNNLKARWYIRNDALNFVDSGDYSLSGKLFHDSLRCNLNPTLIWKTGQYLFTLRLFNPTNTRTYGRDTVDVKTITYTYQRPAPRLPSIN